VFSFIKTSPIALIYLIRSGVTSYESRLLTKKKEELSPFPLDLVRQHRSAFAELEAGPGASLTVLLALDLARVTGKVSGFLQWFPVIVRNLEQCPADPVFYGAGLSADTATVHINTDIELTSCPGELKGLHDDHLQGFTHQILVSVFLIDEDPALAGFEVNPGHGSLPPARAVHLIFRHINCPRLKFHLFRQLRPVWMVGPGVYLQLGYHLGTEPVLGKHPFDRGPDDLFRFALEHLPGGHALDPARIA